MKNLNIKQNHFSFKLLFIIILTILIMLIKKLMKKKIGIIGLRHEANIGNNLVKYAMFIIFKELGFEPWIIGTLWNINSNITFLQQTTNLRIIKKNFSEIKRKDYDILMVNSDQTWRNFDKHFYDYGFLKFSEKWTIPRFIYGASLGYDYWHLTKEDEIIIKKLIKNFSGISVREKESINLIKKHLGISPILVLDPTFLIDRKYYLNLISNYSGFIKENKNFIFTYLISKDKFMTDFIKKAGKILNCKQYNLYLNNMSRVEDFIFGIVNSKAVITSSFHGTVFSILFNKPFITFIYKSFGKKRYYSIKNLFGIEENRFIDNHEFPNVSLLTKPLNINQTLIYSLKKESIDFIKKNLKIK